MNNRLKIMLAWDYSAEPTWVNGVNYPLEDIVKDKVLRREIEIWYSAFSKAQELLHETKGELIFERKPLSRKEIKQVKSLLRTVLIPWGEKLAKKIGAELEVDWGH